MLRSIAQSPARQTASSMYFSRRVLSTTRNSRVVASATAAAPRLTTSTPLFSSSSLPKRAVTSTNQNLTSRALSSEADKKSGKKEGADKDGSETKEIVMTPGEQVAAASRLTMWFGISVFAGFCAYYIGKELIPTKMSPNRVFDKAFSLIRQDPEVKRRYGDSLKAFGRDHGGRREGRRNFVEHTEYVDKEDGSKRTRVRFNIEGQFGTAFCFAEVSNSMPSGEFVYVMVQDKSNGRVHTIQDNRAAMTSARLSGGSSEAQSVMSQLLSGNKK